MMDDFIALRCPSCGGHVHVEKDLENIYCTHCGSQLILKRGADGLLIPYMARDLNASVRMKETEAALLMMETLKGQVKELEAQVYAVRVALWTQVMQGGVKKNVTGYIYSETDAMRRINQYTEKMTGIPAIVIKRVQWSNDDMLAPEKLARSLIVALTTPEELLACYQYLIQPQGYDQTAYRLATALYPMLELAPVLKAKKEKLKQTATELFEGFVRS